MIIMFRKFRKIEKEPDLVECYIISKKSDSHLDRKLPYVAFYYREPDTGNEQRFFINDKSRIRDRKHKKYSILFSFISPVGYIIETREKPGAYSKKNYYVVRKSAKNHHLRIISEQWAVILSKKLSRKLSKENRHSRHIPPYVRMEVFHRDQGKCVNCGDTIEIQYDHIIPFSLGSSNSTNNIQILCKRCNLRKSNNLTVSRRNRFAFSTRKNSKNQKFSS